MAHASFIIETGFNLFIVYQILREVKLEDDDNNNKDNTEEEKESVTDKLKNSIIGKLLMLIKNIIISINEMVMDMKKHAESALLG